jgi:hypothetical protein
LGDFGFGFKNFEPDRVTQLVDIGVFVVVFVSGNPLTRVVFKEALISSCFLDSV